MEITDRVVLFYLHDGIELHKFERTQGFLQALATKGYLIFAEAEYEKIWPSWRDWTADLTNGIGTPAPLQAGFSQRASSEVEQFCKERQKSLRLQGLSLDPGVRSKSGRRLLIGFEWSLGLDEEEGAIYIGYLRHHFTLLQDEWEAYNHWLEILQPIYNTWHPIYGYTIDTKGGEKETSREDILAHKISYLYEINLFGPEIVEKLGRERVESAPAQIVTPLDDGGIMLIPCENLLPDFFQYNYAQIAEYLGLADPNTQWEAPQE
ncbi:MAG TPA: hypothetical protein VFV38_30265 [Ktedonobacteraceae bacterium]|nr:hypothetical protein [Ktedonobacteraceae bacterium]